MLSASLLGLLLMSYRMWKLNQFAIRQKKSITKLASFGFFASSLLFTFFLFLESIDLFAFKGIYSVATYLVLDEFASASLLSVGVLIVDFWFHCARGIGKLLRCFL